MQRDEKQEVREWRQGESGEKEREGLGQLLEVAPKILMHQRLSLCSE